MLSTKRQTARILGALRDTEKPVIRRGSVPFAKIVLGKPRGSMTLICLTRTERRSCSTSIKPRSMWRETLRISKALTSEVQELQNILKDTEDVLSDLRNLRREIRQNDEMNYIKQNLLYTIEQEEPSSLCTSMLSTIDSEVSS